MTVLTQPRPGDTGEIHIVAEGRTQVIRPPADPDSPAAAHGEATTRISEPALDALLAVGGLRRQPADPHAPTELIETPAVPTGAELTVAAPSDTEPPQPQIRVCCALHQRDDLVQAAARLAGGQKPTPAPKPRPSRAVDQADGNVVAWAWIQGEVRWVGQPTRGYVGAHRRPSLASRIRWTRGAR